MVLVFSEAEFNFWPQFSEFAKIISPHRQNDAQTSILIASGGPDDRCKNSRCSAYVTMFFTSVIRCIRSSSPVLVSEFYYKQTKAASYMWPIKFVHGAVPGKRSSVEPSDEAKQIKRKQYERERRLDQSFTASLQENREWLKYDRETKLMSCSLCIRYFSITGSKCSENLTYFVGPAKFCRTDILSCFFSPMTDRSKKVFVNSEFRNMDPEVRKCA